jgi:hypothetical protein
MSDLPYRYSISISDHILSIWSQGWGWGLYADFVETTDAWPDVTPECTCLVR